MKKITVLAGDGIGPEIMESALTILDQASEEFEYTLDYQAIGGDGIDKEGAPFPQSTKTSCLNADAILLGAIGGPKWEDAEETPEMGLLSLRKELELYANLRPIHVQGALTDLSPLKEEVVKGTDILVVRELIGGLYFGQPKHHNEVEAVDTMYYDREGIERIVRKSFQLAQERKKKLTSVDKANVLANSKLWRKIVKEISKEYPTVEVDHLYVDAASMKLITNPSQFDVIVTENMFGDILSDEASVIPGSLGLLPSASLSANGPALYEPIHGSAPDIAGADLANPMSMILSVTFMLRQSFNEYDLSQKIEDAAFQVMEQGIKTKDLKGNASTSEFTQAVVNQLKS